MADGLVSRGGYRRVLPDTDDVLDAELWAENAERLADLAKQHLRGRNATVFEGLLVNPLLGRGGRTVQELAAQFGVSSERIYRVMYDAKQRITAAIAGTKTTQPEERKRNDWHGLHVQWVQSEADVPPGWTWRSRGTYSDRYENSSTYDSMWVIYRVLHPKGRQLRQKQFSSKGGDF
jgi:hypothetical protein